MKLTLEQAEEVRREWNGPGRVTQKELCAKWGVSTSLMWRILNYRSHVPDTIRSVWVPVPNPVFEELSDAAVRAGKPLAAWILSCAVAASKRRASPAGASSLEGRTTAGGT